MIGRFAAPPRAKLDARRKLFGFIFQQPFLVPYLHILENVLVPIENAGADDIAHGMELLDALDIVDLAHKFLPNECSGGEYACALRWRAAVSPGIFIRG